MKKPHVYALLVGTLILGMYAWSDVWPVIAQQIAPTPMYIVDPDTLVPVKMIKDPCLTLAWTTLPISQTATTKYITRIGGKKNYICALVAVTGVGEIMNIVEGTVTLCGTGTVPVVGSLTAANGLNFDAHGGFVNPIKIPGIGTDVDTCITQSGSNRIAGYLAYVQQ